MGNSLNCMQCLPVKVGVMLLDCLDSLGVVLDDLGVAAGVPVGGGGPAMFCVLAAKLACSNKMISSCLQQPDLAHLIFLMALPSAQ